VLRVFGIFQRDTPNQQINS